MSNRKIVTFQITDPALTNAAPKIDNSRDALALAHVREELKARREQAAGATSVYVPPRDLTQPVQPSEPSKAETSAMVKKALDKAEREFFAPRNSK